MKTIHHYLLIILLIGLCSAGCKRKPKLTAEYIDSLKNTYVFLSNQVNKSWNEMIAEDDQKINNLKNLLDMATRTGKYDTGIYNELVMQLHSLTKSRYNQENMANSNLIDLYDSLTVKLLQDVDAYIHIRPDIAGSPELSRLESSINSLDEDVLLQRINYDREAKQFNKFVEENQEVLKQVFPEGKYTKKPLFELQAN